MTKKITAIFLALCMAISVWPMTIQAASKPDIKVGDYVKMGAYNNASILWRCGSRCPHIPYEKTQPLRRPAADHHQQGERCARCI